jgi:hypothetical protein
MRVVPALACLVAASVAGATSFVKPDFDDPRVKAAIARVLESAHYQTHTLRPWGRLDVDGGGDITALELPDVLQLDDRRSRLARAHPSGRVLLRNPTALAQSFDLFDQSFDPFQGERPLGRVTVDAYADFALAHLPLGVVRVRRVGSTVDAWICVTQWPARVLRVDGRASFELPRGSYRLHAWHPDGGADSVVVTAN